MDGSTPSAFIWRRLHSLTGVFFTLFLIEHLFVNSQAALWIGDDGDGFVQAVNAIHNLPYLPVIELFLLGVPILIHMIWGIQYLRTSQPNTFDHEGKPYLPEYGRNHAYTWQRITAWLLLFAVIAHVVQMRFIEAPVQLHDHAPHQYLIKIYDDPGLSALILRLNAERVSPSNDPSGKIIVRTPDFGTAELLIVRDTFKMPLMLTLYTIFVLSACFHGFNGLWTFLIKWGVTISVRSQQWMLRFSKLLMIVIAFLGLAAIWGTYWLNLKQ